jgi:hypothetical protein
MQVDVPNWGLYTPSVRDLYEEFFNQNDVPYLITVLGYMFLGDDYNENNICGSQLETGSLVGLTMLGGNSFQANFGANVEVAGFLDVLLICLELMEGKALGEFPLRRS